MKRTSAERFWKRVDKSGPLPAHAPAIGNCWTWLGSKNNRGYGQFSINDKLRRAHQVAFELDGGVIHSGHEVCHECDNPSCVRPSHLKSKTHSQNMLDCVSRSRHVTQAAFDKLARGSRVAGSILTDDKVLEIRSRFENGEKPKPLASEFGISQVHIYSILNRRTWKHI